MSDDGHEPYAYNPFVSDMTARQQHQQWTEAELDILRARGKPPLATRTPGLDSTDALLDALICEVAELRAMVAELRQGIQEHREIEAKRQASRDEMNRWLWPAKSPAS